METFDQSRFKLGGLCHRAHDHLNTGKSLRYRSGASPCVTCAIEYRRVRDAKKREARLAAAPKYPQGMKKCAACAALVPLGVWRCKPCIAAYALAYNTKNKDKVRIRARESSRRFRVENWHLSLWRGSRSSAKTRKLSHELSPEQIFSLWEKQGGRCHWTGVAMLIDAEPGHLLRVSLDRVEPSVGYQSDNVVLACLFVNIGRRNRSPAETVSAIVTMKRAK